MNSGKMDTRIRIEIRTYTIVNARKVYTEWIEYYSCWCEVMDLIKQEKYEAYNSKLENSLKFKCRLCQKLKTLDSDIRLKNTGKEYRIIKNGVSYNIIFVDSLGNSKTEIVFQGLAVT